MKSYFRTTAKLLATATVAFSCHAATNQVTSSTNNPAATKILSEQEIVEAALNGDVAAIEAALKQGRDVNARDPEKRALIMYAAFNGQTELVKTLVKAGADVNVQDATGSSALMFAASGANVETVKVLLDAGAKINMVDNNEHFSALMWAAAEGQEANVKLLLEKGADLSMKDVDGDTAESFAGKAGHYKVARLLKAAAKEKAAAAEQPKDEAAAE